MGTGDFGVRVDDGHSDIRQHLPTLKKTDTVGSSSLQDGDPVHSKSSLVHVHRGGLGMLGTLQWREVQVNLEDHLQN